MILYWNNWFEKLYQLLGEIGEIIKKELVLDDFSLLREDVVNKIKKISKEKHIFPTTVVKCDREIFSVYNYIIEQIEKIWIDVRYLKKEYVDWI